MNQYCVPQTIVDFPAWTVDSTVTEHPTIGCVHLNAGSHAGAGNVSTGFATHEKKYPSRIAPNLSAPVRFTSCRSTTKDGSTPPQRFVATKVSLTDVRSRFCSSRRSGLDNDRAAFGLTDFGRGRPRAAHKRENEQCGTSVGAISVAVVPAPTTSHGYINARFGHL